MTKRTVHKKKINGRSVTPACGTKAPMALISGASFTVILDGKTGKRQRTIRHKKVTCANCLKLKRVEHKLLGPETLDALRMTTKSGAHKKGKYGALCYVVIGNYQGKGKDRVIAHEVELDGKGGYAYGNRRTWNFPTR